MKDIRIISGKQILPGFDATAALLGYKNTNISQSKLRPLFQELSPALQMRIRAKAALLITNSSVHPLCKNSASPVFLYAMLTIGEGASRLIKKYTAEQDMLKATIADAMADSCLLHLNSSCCLRYGRSAWKKATALKAVLKFQRIFLWKYSRKSFALWMQAARWGFP